MKFVPSTAIPPLAFNKPVKVVMPVTPKVASKVTASSTLNVPRTVVITPVAAKSTFFATSNSPFISTLPAA